MAVVMKMRWDGATREQYEEARAKVGWEVSQPSGGHAHVCWFADGAMHVVDVWDSEADFNRFAEERLMPTVQEIGIPGQPQVEMHPAHALHIASGATPF